MPLRVDPVRDRTLHRLLESATRRLVRKGEVLYRRGDAAPTVLVLDQGHAGLRLPAKAARSYRTVAVAGPGELFGEEGMIPGALRPYTAVAGSRGFVRVLDGPSVRAIVRASAHTLTTYLEAKEKELQRLRSAVSGSPGPTARERLAAVIVDLAERFGAPSGEDLHIPHWFTHRELADLAGAHRSTVTTSLNDWIWRKMLATQGRALVLTEAGVTGLREEGGLRVGSVDPTPRQD